MPSWTGDEKLPARSCCATNTEYAPSAVIDGLVVVQALDGFSASRIAPAIVINPVVSSRYHAVPPDSSPVTENDGSLVTESAGSAPVSLSRLTDGEFGPVRSRIAVSGVASRSTLAATSVTDAVVNMLPAFSDENTLVAPVSSVFEVDVPTSYTWAKNSSLAQILAASATAPTFWTVGAIT